MTESDISLHAAEVMLSKTYFLLSMTLKSTHQLNGGSDRFCSNQCDNNPELNKTASQPVVGFEDAPYKQCGNSIPPQEWT